jgi:hypothetical protein
MRVRTQKANILVPPKYEKDVGSVLVYDDQDRVLFAVTISPAGTYSFTHVGQPEIAAEVKRITGMAIEDAQLHIVEAVNAK